MWHYKQIPTKELPLAAVACLNRALHELNAYWPVSAPVHIRYIIESDVEGADFSVDRRWQAICYKMKDGSYLLCIRVSNFKTMVTSLVHEYRHVWDFESSRKYDTPDSRDFMEGLALVWEELFTDAFMTRHPDQFQFTQQAVEKWRKRIGHPFKGNAMKSNQNAVML